MLLNAGHATHPGAANQQNSSYHSVVQQWVTGAQVAEKGRLYLVATDMSDEPTAETSRHAISRLCQLYYTYPSTSVRESLQNALNRVNREIYEEGERHQSTKCVSLLVAAIQGNRCTLANVGTTRAYLVHKGQLQQITPTRTTAEVCLPEPELVEGEPVSEHGQNPVYSLGNSQRMLADFGHLSFAKDDTLLLGTSGLYEALDESQVVQTIAESHSPQEAANQLVGLVSRDESGSATTVVILSATGGGASGGPMSQLASWMLWAIGGVAIVSIGAILMALLDSPSTPKNRPASTPTRTQTTVNRTRTATLPAILRPTSTPEPRQPTTVAPPPTATRVGPAIVATATRPVAATHTPVALITPEHETLAEAPTLIAPYESEPVYQEENSVLIWQWRRRLGPGEFFAVRIWRDGDPVPGSAQAITGALEYRFGLPLDRTGKQRWNITVVKESASGYVQISESSESRAFWWMGPRPKQPTSTPLPPTDTPIPPTDTLIPPTSTLAPTDTPVPPTDTPVPPTDTPVPPTHTPLPPTPTPLP